MREKAEKPAKRKLTRAERKQIEAVIRQAKGDGKAHTVQDSIPFQNMFPDGLCRLEGGAFSKTIAFEDVNYRLAGPEDQRSIFESLCDFYNGYDPSIGVQVSLDSRSGGSAADEMFGIRRQGNDLDPIRDEAVDILRMQYKRGNNGYVKTKYRSTLKPAAFRDKSPSSNLSAQVIRQEQPLSEKAALNPDWVEWLMGFPPKWTDASFGVPSPKESPA